MRFDKTIKINIVIERPNREGYARRIFEILSRNPLLYGSRHDNSLCVQLMGIWPGGNVIIAPTHVVCAVTLKIKKNNILCAAPKTPDRVKKRNVPVQGLALGGTRYNGRDNKHTRFWLSTDSLTSMQPSARIVRVTATRIFSFLRKK